MNITEDKNMKALVAYFSASGQTAKLAKTIAGVTGGNLFEIAPETAYTWTGWTKRAVAPSR